MGKKGGGRGEERERIEGFEEEEEWRLYKYTCIKTYE